MFKGGAAPTKSILDNVFDLTAPGARKCGKGYALFLKGSPDKREEWGGVRRSLIERAGIRGDVEVQDQLGNLHTDVRSYIFDNGRAIFLGVLADRTCSDPPGEELLIKLNRAFHVYDVRRHQYLGETDSVHTGILPCEPKLLAFLPERLAGLEVSLAKDAYKPGDVVELRGTLFPSTLKDVSTVVHVDVLHEGKALEAHACNVAFQGALDHPIPLSLNQDKGYYEIRTTEVISGYAQTLKFEVK